MPGEPKHRVIADDLKRRIEAGELRGGEQLPTELELRDSYEASRNTVRDALRSLIVQGLVETQPGRGTFVTRKIQPFRITFTKDPETGFGGGEGRAYVREIEAQGRVPSASAPRVEIQQATAETASALGITEGAQVVSRHQQRFIDGIPWSLQTSFYSWDLVDRGATELTRPVHIHTGAVAYLEQQLGIIQAGYRDLLYFRAASESEVRFFGLPTPSGIGVLENQRIGYDQQRKPVRSTITVFPADRVEIAVVEGEVPPIAASQDEE